MVIPYGALQEVIDFCSQQVGSNGGCSSCPFYTVRWDECKLMNDSPCDWRISEWTREEQHDGILD